LKKNSIIDDVHWENHCSSPATRATTDAQKCVTSLHPRVKGSLKPSQFTCIDGGILMYFDL
jgi:hypothetical protein